MARCPVCNKGKLIDIKRQYGWFTVKEITFQACNYPSCDSNTGVRRNLDGSINTDMIFQYDAI